MTAPRFSDFFILEHVSNLPCWRELREGGVQLWDLEVQYDVLLRRHTVHWRLSLPDLTDFFFTTAVPDELLYQARYSRSVDYDVMVAVCTAAVHYLEDSAEFRVILDSARLHAFSRRSQRSEAPLRRTDYHSEFVRRGAGVVSAGSATEDSRRREMVSSVGREEGYIRQGMLARAYESLGASSAAFMRAMQGPSRAIDDVKPMAESTTTKTPLTLPKGMRGVRHRLTETSTEVKALVFTRGKPKK